MRIVTRAMFLLFIPVMITCGPNLQKMQDMSPEEQFALGKELFNKGDYRNSILAFNRIARLSIYSQFSDSAQFMLAESHFKSNTFIVAENEYRRLVTSFSGSLLVKDAMYKICLCFYSLSPRPELDQEYTIKAWRAFQQFLSEYPYDTQYVDDVNEKMLKLREKLAEKQLKNAILYQKMGHHDAAIQYFDDVLLEYHDTNIAPKALFHKAESLLKLNRFDEAKETFDRYLEFFPGHEWAHLVNEKLNAINITKAKIDTVDIRFNDYSF